MSKQSLNVYFDEAGRGPLAGPLYIGLVCTLKKLSKNDLKLFGDSKQFSENKRKMLFEDINNLQKEGKILTTIARVTAAEIDKYGMTNAIHCAILRGMYKIFNELFKENTYEEDPAKPTVYKDKTKN